MRVWVAAALLAALCAPATAQHGHRHGGHGHSPYAGMQNRPIKALTEQQLSDLRAGRGMGLALAAELNGYPGPLHVLELAEPLQLDPAQKQRVQSLYDAMKAEAITAGERLIDSERILDDEFAARRMTTDRLTALTAQIAARQGELRAVHLKYHLTTAQVLSAEQRKRYNDLRGYR